jgi:hypothetical protein
VSIPVISSFWDVIRLLEDINKYNHLYLNCKKKRKIYQHDNLNFDLKNNIIYLQINIGNLNNSKYKLLRQHKIHLINEVKKY